MFTSCSEFLNSLEFPGHRNVFCSNEVTLDGLLDGAGGPKDKAMIRSIELLVQPTFSGQSLEIELAIGYAYLMKPL